MVQDADPFEAKYVGPNPGQLPFDGYRGSRNGVSSTGLMPSGAGRQRRSTLPVAVSGSASSMTKMVGIANSGTVAASDSRSSRTVGTWAPDTTM